MRKISLERLLVTSACPKISHASREGPLTRGPGDARNSGVALCRSGLRAPLSPSVSARWGDLTISITGKILIVGLALAIMPGIPLWFIFDTPQGEHEAIAGRAIRSYITAPTRVQSRVVTEFVLSDGTRLAFNTGRFVPEGTIAEFSRQRRRLSGTYAYEWTIRYSAVQKER